MRAEKIAAEDALRRGLAREVGASQERLIEICRRLVRAPSGNPPGDTSVVAEVAAEIAGAVDGAEVDFVTAEYPIVNVVCRLRGRGSGRRLVFNGHLDTYPIGDPALWSVDPLAGEARDGRLYGRGVSDMKGGIACSLLAFELLARHRDAWAGEVVLTLAGDEETMGSRGTAFLLETVPHASGDAMICGDAGSPRVVRFGEKGMLWVEISAAGRAAHGAHVHLGESAVERLLLAIARLARLRRLRAEPPAAVAQAIRRAKAISEAISGAGEARVLRSVTMNCGLLEGGTAPNLVPDRARATVDIRIPVGVSVAEIERRIGALLGDVPGVSWRAARRFEPTWTDPQHEIVRLAVAAGGDVLDHPPAVNMRVGASDSRLYRAMGVPTIVCGPTPHNMGGPDEFVTLEDLAAVAHIHAMTAFDFLRGEGETR